jgi:hypothetical protein
MLGYDYPLLGVFWTMFIWFIWIAWIILLFRVFVDIFRSHDMGGWGKALWSIFVILVPFLGVFIYLLVRGHSMRDRDIEEAKQNEEAMRAYVRDVASSGGTADELQKLSQLRSDGVISDQEFEQQKAKLLGS